FSAKGTHNITVQTANGTSDASPVVAVQLTVKSVSYGGVGNIVIGDDYLGSIDNDGNPIVDAIPTPQWVAGLDPTETTSWPVAYVQGSRISGIVDFSISPAPSSPISNVRIEGAVQGIETANSGSTLIATGIVIPTSTTTGPIEFIANNAFLI